MEAEVISTKYIHLTLNETEAKWLKGLVQNQLKYKDLADEPKWENEIRSKFFKVLEGVKL